MKEVIIDMGEGYESVYQFDDDGNEISQEIREKK